MKKSVLLFSGIIVAATALATFNESLKPRAALSLDIAASVQQPAAPKPANISGAPDTDTPAADDTTTVFSPPSTTPFTPDSAERTPVPADVTHASDDADAVILRQLPSS